MAKTHKDDEKEVSPKITRGATTDSKNVEDTAKDSEKEGDEDEKPAKITSKGKKAADSEEEDYLRKYQYKKVNNIPTIGGKGTDPEQGSKAEAMKKSLLEQKRISILIPLDPGSSSKVPYSVTLNGYRLDLPTQTYIDVPEQIAEVVRQSNNQTVAATNQFRIDGDKSKEEAL